MAKKMLSTKDLMKGFGVGHMTIYNWRAGTPTKDPLPHQKDDKGHVAFVESEVKAWAKAQGVSFTAPAVLAERGKPGPQKAAVVAKKAAGRPAPTKPRPSVKAKFARAAKLVEAQAVA